MTQHRLYCAWIAAGLLAVGAGCAAPRTKGGADAAPTAPKAQAPVSSLFAPRAVEIHPFTVLAVDPNTQAWILEARVRLLDALDDTTKAAGFFRFELYEAPLVTSKKDRQRRLEVWHVDLDGIEAHRRHYDPITRTYVFRLRPTHPPSLKTRYRLHAQFTDTTGRRLYDEWIFGATPPRTDPP